MKIEYIVYVGIIIFFGLVGYFYYQSLDNPYPQCESYKAYENIIVECSNEVKEYGDGNYTYTECKTSVGECDGISSFSTELLNGKDLHAVQMFYNKTQRDIFNFFSERINEEFYLLWDGLMDEQEGWYSYKIIGDRGLSECEEEFYDCSQSCPIQKSNQFKECDNDCRNKFCEARKWSVD